MTKKISRPSYYLRIAKPLSWLNMVLAFAIGSLLGSKSAVVPLIVGMMYFMLPYHLFRYGIAGYFDWRLEGKVTQAKPNNHIILHTKQARSRLLVTIIFCNLPFLLYLFLYAPLLGRILLSIILLLTILLHAPKAYLVTRPYLGLLARCSIVVLTFCFGLAIQSSTNYYIPALISLTLWLAGGDILRSIKDLTDTRSRQQHSFATKLGVKKTNLVCFWMFLIASGIIVVTYGPYGVITGVLLAAFCLNIAFFLKYKSDAKSTLFKRAWHNHVALNYIMAFWLVVLLFFACDTLGLGIGRLDLLAKFMIIFAIAQTGLIIHNLLGFRRPVASYHDEYPKISILIHAFNQADNISSTLLAALGQNYPDYEILFTDLGSDDNTAQIAQNFQDDRLIITKIRPCPHDWNINSWASHELLTQASGDVIVVLQADTILLPDTLGAMVGLMIDNNIDVLSLLPADQNKTIAQKMLLNMNRFFLMALYPAAYLNKNLPQYSVAYSGVMTFNAHALDDINGFELVKRSPLEDLEIASAAKRAGKRTAFYLGSDLAIMQNHASLKLISVQNLQRYYPLMRYSYPVSITAITGGFFTLCLPSILLLIALNDNQLRIASLFAIGMAMAVINRLIIAITSRQSYVASLFYPITSLVALIFLFISTLQYELFKPRWQNRTEV